MDEEVVSGDWRSNCKSNTERWTKARKKKILTDVDFLVGEDGNTEILSAHKLVLSLSSPVFETMFYGSLAEKQNPIIISSTCPGAFKNLLKHFYGETIAFESVTMAVMTYFLADEFIVEDLRIASHKYLKDTVLHYGNFWELYLNENFLLIPDMEEKCLDYISKNASVLFKSPQLASLPPNRMGKIVEMQMIDITEFELLRALIEWGSKHVLSPSELNSKISPLLRSIRFHHLTLDEFMKIHTENPFLIELHDAMAIAKHIQDRQTYMLPAWCSNVTEKRIFNQAVPPQSLYFYPPNLQSQRIYWN